MNLLRRFPVVCLIVVACLIVVVWAAARAEEGAPPDLLPTLGSIERLDPRFDALVPRVSRLTPNGGKRTVADNYRGKRFNSPNDCTVHSSGAIYFTDPPDGLKVDLAGNVFATGPGGVLVLAPDGTHLGTFLTGQATANCGFGGDGRTLYMTADSHLCRARLTTTGPLPGL